MTIRHFLRGVCALGGEKKVKKKGRWEGRRQSGPLKVTSGCWWGRAPPPGVTERSVFGSAV